MALFAAGQKLLANELNNPHIQTLTVDSGSLLGVAPSMPVAKEAYQESLVRAWCHFNGTVVDSGNDVTGVAQRFNIAGVHDNGVGDYWVYWETDFSDVNYSVFIGQGTGVSDDGGRGYGDTTGRGTVKMYNDAGTAVDPDRVFVMGIGEQ